MNVSLRSDFTFDSSGETGNWGKASVSRLAHSLRTNIRSSVCCCLDVAKSAATVLNSSSTTFFTHFQNRTPQKRRPDLCLLEQIVLAACNLKDHWLNTQDVGFHEKNRAFCGLRFLCTTKTALCVRGNADASSAVCHGSNVQPKSLNTTSDPILFLWCVQLKVCCCVSCTYASPPPPSSPPAPEGAASSPSALPSLVPGLAPDSGESNRIAMWGIESFRCKDGAANHSVDLGVSHVVL